MWIFFFVDESPSGVWSARTIPFNVDPSNGEMTPFPMSESYSPFQTCTQTGTAVIETTTRSGLIVINPNSNEKVLGWHFPQDPNTSSWGVPEAITYSLDVDKFYERCRLVCGVYSIQAGTVSTTNAALSGSISAVKAYNSLSSLQGNGSSVFQIYSYGNLLGLTPDPCCRIGAIPSWKGVGMIFINNPRKNWSRLEDDSSMTPGSQVDAANVKLKYIDTSNSYDLTCLIPFSFTTTTWLANVVTPVVYQTGPILVDAIRASSLSWALQGAFTVASAGITSVVLVKASLGYKMRDITGTLVNSGTMWSAQCPLSGSNGTSLGLIDFARSGCFPTILNIDETNLTPPVRTIEFEITLAPAQAYAANLTLNWSDLLALNVTIPVNNGMVEGLIQNPLMVSYDGVEVGTKLTILGNQRLETIADSSTAKFVTPLYRKVDMEVENAIANVLSNPAGYGLRYIVSLDLLQEQLNLINSAIKLQVTKKEEQVLATIEHLLNLARAENGLKRENHPEASLKTFAQKLEKGIKRIGKEAYDDIVKPVAIDTLEEVKKLPKTALNRAIEATLAKTAPVASTMTYRPTPISYGVLNQQQVNTTRAASGWPGPRAATFELDETNLGAPCAMMRDSKDPQPIYSSRVVEMKDVSSIKRLQEVSLFPCLYTDESGQFADEVVDAKKTVASLFAVAPIDRNVLMFDTPKTKVGAHWIWNYVPTNVDPIPTSIDPGQDVMLMRVKALSEEHVELVPTKKPVTGLSLDLALWAFSRKVGRGIVFTGAISKGQVQSLPYTTALAKKTFVTNTVGLPLCGNIPINDPMVISVEALIKLAPSLLKFRFSPMRIDSEAWHAHTHLWLDITDQVKEKEDSVNSKLSLYFGEDVVLPLQEGVRVFMDASSYREMKWTGEVTLDELPFKNVQYENDASGQPCIHANLDWGEMHALYKALAEDFVSSNFHTELPDPPEELARAATRAAINIDNSQVLLYLLQGIVSDPKFSEYQQMDIGAKKKYAHDLYKSLHALFVNPDEAKRKFKETDRAGLAPPVGQNPVNVSRKVYVPKKLTRGNSKKVLIRKVFSGLEKVGSETTEVFQGAKKLIMTKCLLYLDDIYHFTDQDIAFLRQHKTPSIDLTIRIPNRDPTQNSNKPKTMTLEPSDLYTFITAIKDAGK